MKNNKQYLLLQQTDKKLAVFKGLKATAVPTKGWVNTFRTALKMSLLQLGNRLNIMPQSVKEIEELEADGVLFVNIDFAFEKRFGIGKTMSIKMRANTRIAL
jgi:hypothetical protein